MSQTQILSINVGTPREFTYQGKLVSTAIWKTAVPSPMMLSNTNLAGDGQADLVNHGGLDKAVLIYSYDHYDYWKQQFNCELAYGSFGENVTVSGLTEHDVCIGDTFQWGDAIIQISQPRYPCYKLDIRHERPGVVPLVLATGFTGYYVRVLQSGMVSKDAGLIRLQKHPLQMSVATVGEVYANKNASHEMIRSILAVDELAVGWRGSFEKRLLNKLD
jgi:MOSC domain-containing protein YiiM